MCLQGRTNAYRNVTVSAKKCKVAINGFGRIGRQFLRCWHGRDSSNLEVVVINDSGGPKQASHLLKYDSTFGTFDADVKVRFPTAVHRSSRLKPGSGLSVTCQGTCRTCGVIGCQSLLDGTNNVCCL